MWRSSVWRSWVLAVAVSVSLVLALARLVPNTPFLALLAITVTLLIGGPAVWNNLESIRERADKRKREHEERDRHERERHQHEADERAAREVWLKQFAELYFKPEPDGERRFVWRVPSDWPAREVPHDVSVLTGEQDIRWLHAAIWATLPDWRPASVPVKKLVRYDLAPDDPLREKATPDDPALLFVYETDVSRQQRRRVRYALQPGRVQFLALEPRRDDRPPYMCPKCARAITSGGVRCPDCNVEQQELNEYKARIYDEIRQADAARKGSL